MKEMEQILGMNFEDDYKEKYLNGELGQKRFADRWRVKRSLIFSKSMRGGRRSWIQMLDLPLKSHKPKEIIREENYSCEICGETNISLDRAHWKENVKGGSTKVYNILNLCPNCHRRLDNGDIKIIEKGRKVLLFREVSKIFNSKITEDSPNELLKICEHVILNRKRN